MLATQKNKSTKAQKHIEPLEVQANLEGNFPSEFASNAIMAAAVLEGVALFELLGAKWMLAVTYKNWNEEIHEHTADEVRHTKIVLDAAKKLRWQMEPQEILSESRIGKICYQATEDYLAKLSKRIFLLTRRNAGENFTVTAYVLLAFLIERRIMKIYPYFMKYGATEELRETAQQLVYDERKHLGFVNNKLLKSLKLAQCTKDEILSLEEELATKWLKQLQDAAKQL